MGEIIVYSTPVCPWCQKLKEYLDEKKVKYKYVDVSADHEAAKAMVEKSGQMGVPQIELDGELIVGFDKEKIDEMIAKSESGSEEEKDEEETVTEEDSDNEGAY